LDDSIEEWFSKDRSSNFTSGFSARVRIVVERVDGHNGQAHEDDDDVVPVRARPID
jgi:hypothetical protein